MFSRMTVHCPICTAEMDGMKGYGREAGCCGKECYEEWEWRRTLAIMGKEYYPKPTASAPLTADGLREACRLPEGTPPPIVQNTRSA